MRNFIGILKYKWGITALYFFLLAFSIWQVVQLSFQHERKRFFPGNDTDLAFTEHFFSEIEQDDIYVFAAVETESSVLDEKNWHLLDSLTKSIQKLETVEAAISLCNLPKLKKAGPNLYPVPLVNPNKERRALDSLAIINHPFVLNNLISEDFRSFGVIIKGNRHDTSQTKIDTAYAVLKRLITKFDFKDWHLSGYPVIQSVSVTLLQWEMAFYTTLSGLILIVVLLLVYRSFPGLIIPMLSLVGGMLFFFAYLQLTGQDLDLMSSLFPILMLIFLMADVIHLQTHYIDMLEEGHEPFEALRISMKEIGLALFLTSFTTAVGFGTLYTSKIEAVRHFGVNSAVGVMIAFVTVMVFASTGLLFFKKGTIKGSSNSNEKWVKLMQKIYEINRKKGKLILGITLTSMALAVVGIMNISTNTFMKDEFPNKEKMKYDFEFFEDKLGGVRSFEMAIIPKGERKVDDAEVLLETGKLEDYLKAEQGMHNILSPVAPYRAIHQAYTREKSNYSLPEKASILARYRTLVNIDTSSTLKVLMNQNHTMGRMSARLKDLGSNVHAERNNQIRSWIANNIDTNTVQFRVVGTTLMYDKNHEYLRISLLKTMGLAFLIVGFLFSVLFKDYRMVIVSLLPNILPLALAAAAMGFLGITLYSLTSIFFAISFGIAVDDTIHFLTRYKLERRKGKTVDKAIKYTMHISGKAIILTSVILIVSFLVLMFSSFKGTYYIGVLVSITLVAAVLSDLFLLPQLLYLINKRQAQHRGKKML
ncbi:MAG: MMPL family transporter [Bacteroidetes bacterium]|nr:MMPL family transporter [Bacteroidota bacterium]